MEIEKYHFLKDEPKKRQFDIYDLSVYQKKNVEHSSKPHTHSFYQIIWFKNNTGKHFIDFKSYDIKKDRLFFVAKNQVHYFENRADYEGYLIHFNESFILNNETDINFFLAYHIFNNTSNPYFQVSKDIENQIFSYFSQIDHESSKVEEFGNNAILSHLLKSLLLIIEREKRRNIEIDQKKPNQNKTYLIFRNLLENNFHKNWAVSDYANELSISTKSLNAVIKSELGITVSQTITDRVILEAKRKLTHSNVYINQIGYDLGFKDPYYFIKYFKKHVKCSPTEFRDSIS
jgi:AraC-like DNA-binding protein